VPVDISKTGVERGRPVIYRNLALCDRVSADACNWFLLHEYGHVALERWKGDLAVPTVRDGRERPVVGRLPMAPMHTTTSGRQGNPEHSA
jgi:hypothetical protein